MTSSRVCRMWSWKQLVELPAIIWDQIQKQKMHTLHITSALLMTQGFRFAPECLCCYSSSQQWPRLLRHGRNCQETYQQLHRSHSWLPCKFEDVKDWAVQPHQALLQTVSSSLPNLVTKIDHGMSQFQDTQMPMTLYGLQANPSNIAELAIVVTFANANSDKVWQEF